MQLINLIVALIAASTAVTAARVGSRVLLRGRVGLQQTEGWLKKISVKKVVSTITDVVEAVDEAVDEAMEEDPLDFKIKTIGSFGSGGSQDMDVIFKYAEIVDQAMKYKIEHPSSGVFIKFVIYKMEKDVWACVDSTKDSYGKVFGSPKCESGVGNDKLIYKLLTAAIEGVDVSFVYQNPYDQDSDEMYGADTLWDYVKELHRPANFHIRRADWAGGNYKGQSHNKFMLASHALDAEGDWARSVTFVTTANVDDPDSSLKDYVQSGVLAKRTGRSSKADGLFEAYSRYFDVVFEHSVVPDQVAAAGSYQRRYDFWEEMEDHDLNWASADGTLEAYFYPLPSARPRVAGNVNTGCADSVFTASGAHSVWNVAENAVAKYVTEAANDNGANTKYVKVNMYHLKSQGTGSFVDELARVLRNISPLHLRGVYKKDSGCNTRALISGSAAQHSISVNGPYNSCGADDWNDAHFTHTKNYNVVYKNAQGETEYVTITGSTNGKSDGYMCKANNQLVVKERAWPSGGNPPVYAAHKGIFYRAFEGSYKYVTQSSDPHVSNN